MNVFHLNLRDLKYLCAVAEHLHFTRAANACSISQPALSERIRHIEGILDTRVFERSRRSVLVTERGEQVLAIARGIVDLGDQLDQEIRKSQEPLQGGLKLGVIATLGPYLMPHLLRPLRDQYPRLKLQLVEGLTDALLTQLNNGALDIVLAAPPIQDANIREDPLFFEPFWLAEPRTRQRFNQSVSPSALQGEEMVLLSEGHCLSGQALAICRARQRAGAQNLQATSLETLRHMVASGDRYTMIPWLAVGNEPPLGEFVRYLPIEGEGAGRTISIFSRASYRGRHHINALKALIVANLPEGIQRPPDPATERTVSPAFQ